MTKQPLVKTHRGRQLSSFNIDLMLAIYDRVLASDVPIRIEMETWSEAAHARSELQKFRVAFRASGDLLASRLDNVFFSLDPVKKRGDGPFYLVAKPASYGLRHVAAALGVAAPGPRSDAEWEAKFAAGEGEGESMPPQFSLEKIFEGTSNALEPEVEASPGEAPSQLPKDLP